MDTLKDFMVDQLNELYTAEIQLKKLMVKMAEGTSNESLRHAFELHAKERSPQSKNLDRIFITLNVNRNEVRSSAIMDAIAKEVYRLADLAIEPEIRDAVFIALAQKAKHYEIALCGTLRDYANVLNNIDAENVLSEMLVLEKESDRDLTYMARTGINQRAAQPTAMSTRFASSAVKGDEEEEF
jgi:ferritin-like metal-binding protein YciE